MTNPSVAARLDSVPAPPTDDAALVIKMKTEDLRVWYGQTQALSGVSLRLVDRHVTAIIGPAGCGKTTLLRCLNRMVELAPDGKISGRVLLDDVDIYSAKTNPITIRRRVGMVFPKPNPFPNMTVFANVLSGMRLNGIRPSNPEELVERSLRQAALWDEVKDGLHRPAPSLSLGQQQRLCVARALALEPEVLLMDEPTSRLDPVATSQFEDLVHDLRQRMTVVLGTQNIQQAARVSDFTGFLYLGDLVEFERTERMFTNPREQRTEDYVTGKFG